MSDEKGKNLIKYDKFTISKGHPELKEVLKGLAPVYATLIFARSMQRVYSKQEIARIAGTRLKTISHAEFECA